MVGHLGLVASAILKELRVKRGRTYLNGLLKYVQYIQKTNVLEHGACDESL